MTKRKDAPPAPPPAPAPLSDYDQGACDVLKMLHVLVNASHAELRQTMNESGNTPAGEMLRLSANAGQNLLSSLRSQLDKEVLSHLMTRKQEAASP